ncbi:MAG: tetratricopeptide repeat protein [Rudaea sp.]|nr:tetratricopeptide repeat protein [Rudaea sp.]
MTTSYSIAVYRHVAPILLAGAVLAGCATAPAARHGADTQPLQRLDVVQVAPETDVLTSALAAEFALADADLEAASRDYAKAAQISDDPAIAAQATRVAIAARQWDQARATLARWQGLNPGNMEIRQAHALLDMHDGKADAAYDDLLQLARATDGNGWRLIAQALLRAEDKTQAGTLLERLATPGLLGTKGEVWVAVSQLAQRLGRKPLAQSLADQAVNKFASADTYTWAAQLKLEAGDRIGARALFADALRHDEENTRLRVAYATLLGELGDNAEAARILAQGPQDAYVYAARAAYAARSNDKALIEPLYRELKGLPEPRPGARLDLLGELAELLERKIEALAWYRQVPADDEHSFEAQMRSAVLLDDSGKSAEALALVHELQARAGDDVKQLGDVFLLEAELHSKHQHDDTALAVYDRGLKALPDDTRLLYARALLNDDLDHVDAAVRDLRRVVELKPDDADALNALGYTLADRTEQKTEALSLIQKALTLKPGEPAIIDSLGWAQYRLGHLDEAVTQLKVAYQKQPDAEIAAHLGEVLWVSGHHDEARKIWDQGQKKDAKNKVLLDTIKRLES